VRYLVALRKETEMGMLKEFRDFAMKGNVVDMAVGVVIGAAFGKIVGALVDKIVMPLTGLLGGVNVADYKFTIPIPQSIVDAATAAGAVAPKPAEIGYGAFLQTIIDFLIVAAAIFVAVKVMNRLKRKEEAAPAPPKEEVVLLREIRDSLRRA
jgi:large conductance mechanosensitive channel